MPLIGTAGHVDHGKSTLIERITGRDPDRWREEKERGLTIDLGFAWANLPGGVEVSFVDVPGHERFLKNMLAGVEAIDVALFVVAADEGWMPQSEEHLAVLDLLGVERGVVALTKIDLVGPDLADLAREEIREHLMGTTLQGAEVVPVSAVTGTGIDDLLMSLEVLIPTDPADNYRPRLWIDRSFSVAGAGTVVTGSLLDGSLSVEDSVEIYPTGNRARVRSLESHERSHPTLTPGRRVAVNLGGIDHDKVTRGHMLGLEGQWDLTRRFSATVRGVRGLEPPERRGDYQLHIGSGAVPVEILGLDDEVAVFRTETPLPLAVGDRFILRDTGRRRVIGGGQVLDPGPGRVGRALKAAREIDPSARPDDIATALIAGRRIDRIERIRAHSKGGTPQDAVIIGEQVISEPWLDTLAEEAVSLVEEEHRRHPLRPGLNMATLAERLGVDGDVAEAVVGRVDRLVRSGPDVSLSDHRTGLSEEQEQQWARAVERLSRGLDVPSDTELGIDPEVLHLKLRSGELVRVGPGLVYLPEQIEELKKVMAGLGEEFTVAQFRDAAGLSRKYAVPILEWSDKEGLTVRRGDLRRLR